MISRRHADSAARALSIAAVFGAVIVVPLIYVPALASPFLLAKQVVFQIAAALGFGALLLFLAAGPPRPVGDGRGADGRDDRRFGPRFALTAAALVLSTGLVSAALADATQIGAPYAAATLGRWAALFGLACGAAVVGADPGLRADVLRAAAGAAAGVSAIGILQHVDLFPLAIPVISPPGSTFGNRNLGGEAVALAIPMGLAAIALARSPRERRLFVAALALDFLYLAATRARGAWIGAAAGVVTVAVLNRRSWSRKMILPGLAIGVLGLVVALLPGPTNPRYASDTKRLAKGVDVVETSFNPDSPALRTRLAFWSRSLAMYGRAPVMGIGPGNWPVIFPRHAEPGAAADGVLTPGLAPRQVHNDLLETLTETGAVGLFCWLVLGSGVVVAVCRQLAAAEARAAAAAADADAVAVAGASDGDSNGFRHRISISAAAGTLVALLGAGVTGFPLQMPGTLVLAGLALGLIFSPGARWSDRSASPGAGVIPGWAAVAVSLLVLSVALIDAQRRIRGSAWLAVAERALHGDPGPEGAIRALRALDRAEAATPGAFRVALRRAHAAVRIRHMWTGAEAAEAALAVEPFSPNAWATLAGAQLGAGNPHAARISADRCLELLNDYPYALYVKARAAEAIGDRIAAEAAWSHLTAIAQPSWPDRETSDSAEALLRTRHPPTEPPAKIGTLNRRDWPGEPRGPSRP